MISIYCSIARGDWFFVYVVEARERASTLNRSGCNTQKQDAKQACMEKENLQGGKTGELGGIWVVFMRVEKIMVLDWGRSEMVVNSCFQDLEVGMRLKRMWKLMPQMGEKSNK